MIHLQGRHTIVEAKSAVQTARRQLRDHLVGLCRLPAVSEWAAFTPLAQSLKAHSDTSALQ